MASQCLVVTKYVLPNRVSEKIKVQDITSISYGPHTLKPPRCGGTVSQRTSTLSRRNENCSQEGYGKIVHLSSRWDISDSWYDFLHELQIDLEPGADFTLCWSLITQINKEYTV